MSEKEENEIKIYIENGYIKLICCNFAKQKKGRGIMKEATTKKISMAIVIILAIIYVIVPVDIIPDLTPIFGFIDDIIAVLIAIGNTIRIIHKIKNDKPTKK